MSQFILDLVNLIKEKVNTLNVPNKNNKFKKTDFMDAVLLRLLYCDINKSQQFVASKINFYKSTEDQVHRTSYTRREEKIPVDFYEQLLIAIIDLENKYFQDEYKVVAFDGTHSHLNRNLGDEGYKVNKGGSVDTLILGVYDVTRNFPIALELTKSRNERKALKDFLSKKEDFLRKFEKSILVFDRGFPSKEVISELEEMGLQYVFRIKKNNPYIDKQRNDYSFLMLGENNDQYPVRVVHYLKNDNDYYLLTNLINKDKWPLITLAQIYTKRWAIEELFKLIKENLKMSNLPGETEELIMKSLYANLIVTHIVSFIDLSYKKEHIVADQHETNKKNLLQGVLDIFLPELFLKKLSRKDALDEITKFVRSYIVVYKKDNGRRFPRIAITPYKKWYFKGRTKRVPFPNMDDDRDDFDNKT